MSQAASVPADGAASGQKWLVALLVAAVMVTAVTVVYARHLNRTLFAELQRHQEQRDNMNIRWGQLQLEQGTWATHIRIERAARERLRMVQPAPSDVIVVRGQ